MSDTPAVQRFFAELMRRHVFRVMAVYGAVGFVVLQIVELAVPALLLPEWTYRLVALLLLIGFPVAVVLAWAFEKTPAGVQRTRAATDAELRAEASAGTRWPLLIAAIAGLSLLGLGAWWSLGRSGDIDRAERRYDSIAVLPFVNITGSAEAEYLGDGLAEELLNAFAGIEGLKVASRTSAFSFKGADADIRTIGDSLGVAVVLEGTVRGAGDRLRITAQLIDSRDGFHVWSKAYDRPHSDLLDLQDDITARIVEALAEELDIPAPAVLLGRGTDDAAAYDLYLQGRHFWNKRTFADLTVAIGLFERAIATDSGFAPAYAAIADAYAVPTGWGDDPNHALDEAKRWARLALDLDPTLAQAHTALAYATMTRDLDFRASEAGFARAIELDPGYATAHQWFAELLSVLDRHDEAVAEVRRAEDLDPTPIIRWNVARILYFAGRYDEALAQIESTLDQRDRATAYRMLSLWGARDYRAVADLMLGSIPPNAPPGVAELFADLGNVPDDDLGRRLAEVFETLPGDDERTAFLHAVAWAHFDADRAFDALERIAAEPTDGWLRNAWLEVLADATFDVLRDDPRFDALNAHFGL